MKVLLGFSIVLCGAALILATACKPGVTAAETDTYFNAQMACVDAGGTRAQIDKCRADAKAKFNASILDGGIEQ